MNLYYYCSYSSSPVGFLLGKFACAEGQTENYQLSEENIPPLIRACFESGMIRKAAGKLPAGSGSYFLLVKELTAKDKENDALTYYLNLALETESFSEFENWLRESGDSEELLAEAIRTTIDLKDRASDFGFSVRSAETAKLVNRSFRAMLPKGALVPRCKDVFHLELTSAQTDLEMLEKRLELPDDMMCSQNKREKKLCYIVKKKRNLLTAVWARLLRAWNRIRHAS